MNKKTKYPRTLAELASSVNVSGFEKIKSWKELYNGKGYLQLPSPEVTEEELEDFDSLEDAFSAVAFGTFKRTKSAIGELINALLGAHEDSQEFTRQSSSWANGDILAYSKGNPARILCQLCAWGIDSTVKGFTLDTPKNWEKRGYKLKDSARPVFVFTPLFKAEDKKKAEEENQLVIELQEESATGKQEKRKYTVHALYASEDAEQVREIKRRNVKKSATTARAEAMREEPKKAPRKAKKKLSGMAEKGKSTKKAAPALAPAPVYMADDAYAQLALGL